MAWPEAPLTRLSMTASTTTVSLLPGRCTAMRQRLAPLTLRVSGWLPAGITLEYAWGLVFEQFVPLENMLPDDRDLVITDDRPFNEYFWLRRTFGGASAMPDTGG